MFLFPGETLPQAILSVIWLSSHSHLDSCTTDPTHNKTECARATMPWVSLVFSAVSIVVGIFEAVRASGMIN